MLLFHQIKNILMGISGSGSCSAPRASGNITMVGAHAAGTICQQAYNQFLFPAYCKAAGFNREKKVKFKCQSSQ